MPSCGFTSAAMTAKIAARSGWSRHSARRPSSRKTTPTESTCPQTTLSNQKMGLTTTTAAPSRASRWRPPSSRIIDHDEVAGREVRDDRRDLDQVADAAQSVADVPTTHST